MISRKSTSLSFTTFFCLQKGFLQNQRGKRIEDAEHQGHQPTERPMCYLGCGRSSRNSYSTKVIHNTTYHRSIESHNHLSFQRYNERKSYSRRRGNEWVKISVEKQNTIGKMFKADPRHLLREVGAVFAVHHTLIWHFLRNELKLFPSRLQNR